MKLENGKIQFSLNQDGGFSLSCGDLTLNSCRPEMTVDGIRISAPIRISAEGKRIILTCSSNLGEWSLAVFPDETPSGYQGIALEMNAAPASVNREYSFAPFAGGQGEITHYLGSGRAGGRAESIVFPAPERSFITYYAAMLSRGNDHLYCTVPLESSALPEFRGKCGTDLNEFSLHFNFLHKKRESASSGRILILGGKNPFDLMREYAAMNRTRSIPFADSTVCGWTSWDYYRWTISEEEVLANADLIAHDPILSRRIRRIIIDDGWQYCYGEWDANPLFPHGMKYLADELTRMGFDPGLWFAPILAEPQSRLAQKSQELFALSEGGQPCLCFECMKRNAFVLDPTLPQVMELIYALFDRYASMGYRYFKLDFMLSVLNARRYHDPEISPGELQRMIVKTAKRGMKGRAKLLGCNYLFAGGNEFVDQVRIGADIHARWEHIRHNAVSIAANWHFNRILWENDPDFALARTIRNCRDKELNRIHPNAVYTKPEDPWIDDKGEGLVTMEPSQAEVLLSLVLISGGVCNLSDNLPMLEQEELDMLHRILSAEPGDAGCPLDLFCAEIPSVWYQKSGLEERLLFINWTDEPVEKEFDLKKYGISATCMHDFWTGDELSSNMKSLAIAPRSCRLLIFPIGH